MFKSFAAMYVKKFIDFVERMLLFYSLDSRGYEGFMNGSESIAEGIVNSGKVKDFQEFLKENDIDYELYGCEVDGRKAIYCHSVSYTHLTLPTNSLV